MSSKTSQELIRMLIRRVEGENPRGLNVLAPGVNITCTEGVIILGSDRRPEME